MIQYLLGMITNLFVQFPEKANEGQLWQFAWKQIPLVLHILVVLSLLIGSLTLTIRSFRSRNKTLKIGSAIGLISIFISGYAGSKFIPTQNADYSFLMSITFILALMSYVWILYKLNSLD